MFWKKFKVVLSVVILLLIIQSAVATATYFYHIRCKTLQADTSITTDDLNIHNDFTFRDSTNRPRQVLKVTTTIVVTGATTAEVVGSTVELPAGMMDDEEAVELVCYGGLIGEANVKTASLYVGNTINASIVFNSDNKGSVKWHYLLIEVGDEANQSGFGDAQVAEGTTLAHLGNAVQTTVDMSNDVMLSVKISTDDAADEFYLYGCGWEYWP